MNIPLNSLTDDIFFFLWTQTDGNDDLIAAWHEKRWEGCQEEQQEDDGWDDDYDYSGDADWEEEMQSAIPPDWRPYLRPGETRWMIERNAAAAGFTGYFHSELKYLKWRSEQEADEQTE